VARAFLRREEPYDSAEIAESAPATCAQISPLRKNAQCAIQLRISHRIIPEKLPPVSKEAYFP